jgi:zinc transport system substrate-binding protein
MEGPLRRAVGLGFAVLATLMGACDGRSTREGGTLEVIAAFYPLAEAARQVGGDRVTVHDLTPAGVEPHDLELKPSDLGRLRSADLILYVGRGFQPALEDAIEASPNEEAAAIDVLNGLPLRPGTDVNEPEDPHVWLDPQLMKRVVERIADELEQRAPGARAVFEAGARDYGNALDELDGSFDEVLRTCMRREVVTTHAAFGYLTARYGLAQIPISGLTPEAEPSPRRIEAVAQLAEDRGATTIYFETLVDPRVADAVARRVGARTAVLNPIEGLTETQRSAGDDYLSLMRANLASLAQGLGCKPV